MRIVFMGTPDFAVESLKVLVEAGQEVVAVITAPDKPAGRGKKLQESAVKTYAKSQGIPVLQPPKLKNLLFLDELRNYNPELQVVVAFRMLPEIVWDMPTKGTINLHGSLLPQYRGAAPINWAVINGETETGATTFFIEKEIDTGKIIFKEKLPIKLTDNAGIIHDKLMVLGGGLVLKTVNAIEEGNFPQMEQEEFKALKFAPKIFKEDCEIDWSKNSIEVYNHIRGLSPYPGAWTSFELSDSDQTGALKIFETEIVIENKLVSPKSIQTDNKSYLHIACADGFLSILHLQMPGKKRMAIQDFLRGNDASTIKII
jgi:methionyl-tRNA formyltransferase